MCLDISSLNYLYTQSTSKFKEWQSLAFTYALKCQWPLVYGSTQIVHRKMCHCYLQGPLQAVDAEVCLLADQVIKYRQFAVQWIEITAATQSVTSEENEFLHLSLELFLHRICLSADFCWELWSLSMNYCMCSLCLIGLCWVLLEAPFLVSEQDVLSFHHLWLQYHLVPSVRFFTPFLQRKITAAPAMESENDLCSANSFHFKISSEHQGHWSF